MIARHHGITLIAAATLFAVSCTTSAPPRVVEDGGATTMAAKHQPAGAPVEQELIVIPVTWKAEHPFSQRFPNLQGTGAGRHVIDLATTRFETDSLVSVGPNGERMHRKPDLTTFPAKLDTIPFLAAGDDYFIVQAQGPADQTALRTWLDTNGIAVLDYIPHFAYLVRATPEQLSAVQQRAEVFWTGHYAGAFRVDPLLDYVIRINPAQRIQLHVQLDAARYDDIEPLLKRFADLGLEKPRAVRRTTDWIVNVEADAGVAYDLALLPGCLWVERFVPPRLQNNTARTSQSIVTGRGAVNGPVMDVEDVWARGIRGEGQIASAADTGLSTGNLATLHQDFGQTGSGTNPMRVLAGYALGRAGNWNDDQAAPMYGGHGTHTSGSIVGNGFRSGASPSTNTFPTTSYAGVAPKAQFVFQSIMDSGGNLGGIPFDLNALFQQTYDDGARVHSNSWGSNVFGQYTTFSRDLDQFTWRNKDMVITFAAGNSGSDGSAPVDGIINTDSIGAPGTAKNGITVGATENYLPNFVYEFPAGDCTSSDGVEQKTWGWFNGSAYFSAPLVTDLMANNANGMGAFSSRGPTDDGRFKPDVVAPGIAIISTRTDVNQTYEQWGICPIPVALRPYYITQGGTSMANPLTAGAATLVRQYYADGWHANNSSTTNAGPTAAHEFNPTSALVKATLINGAWDMSPGQYGTGAAREIPPAWDTGKTLPNNAEGFGRVDVEHSLFPGSGFGDSPSRKLKVHDVTTGLTTGQSSNFTFDVGGNGDPFIVTLVWTDPQAASGAGTKLVNNLDLTVTAPGGSTTYFPNGVDKTSGVDSINNVEQVKVSSPTAGTWSITVTATSVPGNAESGSTAQPFALVMSGESCSNAPSIPTGVTANPFGVNRVNVAWATSTGSPASYRIYRAGPGTACPVGGYTLIGTVNAPAVTYQDTTVSGGVLYSYRVTSVSASGCESAMSSCASATPIGACALPPVFAGLGTVTAPNEASCSLLLSWVNATTACSGTLGYNIYRSTSPNFTPAPANRIALNVSGTTFSDVNVSIGTTYYYIVRAVENGIEETNETERSGAPIGIVTAPFSQNFDALAGGNLAGFTVTGVNASDWRGVMACSPNQSAGNVFRFGGASCSSTYANGANTQVTTSGLAVPAGATNARLDFWHRWEFESSYDGGRLLIQRSGDAGFTAIPASAILTTPYNGTALSVPVWTGNANTAMVNTVVDLDAACNAIAGNTGGCAGKTIFVAFNALSDSSITRLGWFIDDVEISYQTPCTSCTPPATPTGLALTTPSANTVRLTWNAGAPSYNVYRETGACPVSAPVRIASGINGTTYDDTGLAGGTAYRYIVRAVSAGGCESGNSGCQSATPTGASLAPPPGLVATASGTSAVGITWRPVVGAVSYTVERSPDNAAFTPIGITSGISMTDGGVAANTGYVYRATAKNGGGTISNASNKDVTATMGFTDPTLVADTTEVKVVHLTQLRTAVNAVRVAAGLSAATFTDPVLTAEETVCKRLHVTELRTNLDAARTALGLAALIYTDPTITAGTTIISTPHIEQLRNGTK